SMASIRLRVRQFRLARVPRALHSRAPRRFSGPRKGGALREGRGVCPHAHERDRRGDSRRSRPPRRDRFRPGTGSQLERARAQGRSVRADGGPAAARRRRLCAPRRSGLCDRSGAAHAYTAPPRFGKRRPLPRGGARAAATVLLCQHDHASLWADAGSLGAAGNQERWGSGMSTERRKLTIDTTSAPRKAGQKPSTWKPRPSFPDSAPVSQRTNALITNVKSPRVRINNGQVRSARTGLTRAFKRPKTRATRIR